MDDSLATLGGIINPPIPETDRDKIKAIGGSQIGAIIGVNDYMTALDVYHTIKYNKPIPDNKYMKAGRKLETVVADYFKEETKRDVAIPEQRIVYHKEYPFLCASLDRIYNFQNEVLHTGVLECKTSQVDWKDEVPASYVAQVIWYMGMMNFSEGSIACLTRGLDFNYKDIEFIPALYEQLLQSALDFWNNHILKGIPPEARTGEDVRRYIRNHITGKVIVAVPETYKLAVKYAELKSKESEIKKELDDLKDRILPIIKDAEALTDSKGNILMTYKKDKDGKTFDEKSFKEKNPEVYNSFLVTKEGARKLLNKLK